MLKVDRSHRDLVLGWFKEELTKLEDGAAPGKADSGLNAKSNEDYHEPPKRRDISVANIIGEKMRRQIQTSKTSIGAVSQRERFTDADTENDSKVSVVTRKKIAKIPEKKAETPSCKAAAKNRRNKLRKQIKKLEIKLSQDSAPCLLAKMDFLRRQLAELAPEAPNEVPGPEPREYGDRVWKRKKIRSRQKNIRKDNRPDHLKPPHLRKNATQ